MQGRKIDTIVIVDDEKLAGKYITRFIEKTLEKLSLINAENPIALMRDLIKKNLILSENVLFIIDNDMPEMTGEEFISLIRNGLSRENAIAILALIDSGLPRKKVSALVGLVQGGMAVSVALKQLDGLGK